MRASCGKSPQCVTHRLAFMIAFLLLFLKSKINGNIFIACSAYYISPIFNSGACSSKREPSKVIGVELEMPNFTELFARIQHVSPLARLAISKKEGGFAALDIASSDDRHVWKTLEHCKVGRKPIHQIHKIDNYQDLGRPMLRFRSSLHGPCIGERFANFIMNFEERKKWDPQIASVCELYPILDIDAANVNMGFFRYGECSRLGIGYVTTKPNLVSSAREQLTMCGIQDFPDGKSCIIWGTEMDDRHNRLLPGGVRRQRARTHLFATTLMPTGPNSFDVEYILQLDCGGNIPSFLTTPVIIETVKSLFNHAKNYFGGGEDSELAQYLNSQQQMDSLRGLFTQKKGILFTA